MAYLMRASEGLDNGEIRQSELSLITKDNKHSGSIGSDIVIPLSDVVEVCSNSQSTNYVLDFTIEYGSQKSDIKSEK